MQIKSGHVAVIGLLALTVGIMISPLINLNLLPVTGSSTENSLSSGINYNSIVCVYKNGVLVEPCHHNLLLTAGKNMTRDLLATASNPTGRPTFIALGNGTGTQAVGDTVLATEIGTECSLGRAAGTVNYDTANPIGNWSITKTFTSTCNNAVVNTTALYNATTSATNWTFAETTFTSTTLQANDQINITWFVFVS